MRDLVPIFRQKELYTIFYDIKKGSFVKRPHRKPNVVLYVASLLILLRVIPYIDRWYDLYDHLGIKLLFIAGSIGITIYATYELYVRYYEQDKVCEMFPALLPITELFVKGRKQFWVETIVTLLFLAISIISIALFLLFRQFIYMIIANFLYSPCLVFLWMRPYKRMKLLRKSKPPREETNL